MLINRLPTIIFSRGKLAVKLRECTHKNPVLEVALNQGDFLDQVGGKSSKTCGTNFVEVCQMNSNNFLRFSKGFFLGHQQNCQGFLLNWIWIWNIHIYIHIYIYIQKLHVSAYEMFLENV